MSTREERYDEAIEVQQQGDIGRAIDLLKALVADHPDYALAHAALSVFFSRTGDHDNAIEHGQKVCEIEAADPFSFVAMSLICHKAGRLAEAEQALMHARQVEWGAHQKTEDE